ncbi:MAG: hypothetical protein M3324_06305, partial [Actinomycetota bacterium]|nr:hypothetical protein [Actinomycetota bacterium]
MAPGEGVLRESLDNTLQQRESEAKRNRPEAKSRMRDMDFREFLYYVVGCKPTHKECGLSRTFGDE